MGAGKSKIGPVLAGKFACPFYDCDKLIELETGKKIGDIFNEQGEAYFRQLESRMLEKLAAQNEKSVIALGGGALVDDKNRMIAESKGTVIYIKSSPQSILERVKNSKKRPLLDIPRDETFEKNLLNKIIEMLDKRKAIYESADIVFERDGFEFDEAGEIIYQKLKNYENH